MWVMLLDKIKQVIENLVKYHTRTVVIAALIVAVVIIIKNKVLNKLYRVMKAIIKKSVNKIDDKIIAAVEKPAGCMFFTVILYFALMYLYKQTGYKEIMTFANKLLKVSLILCLCWIIYNFNLENSILYNKLEKKCMDKDKKIIFPFVSIVIRIAIIIIIVLVIVKEFKLTGFFTGLGLGGLAIALAAQDTLSNLFGGMIIVLDKPFCIGDWIQTNEIEGIVEEITFRSTKIRTFAKALVTIPNSKLANADITNWAQRNRRRIHFKITLSEETSSESLHNCVERIEKMINSTKGITDELNIINFDGFTDEGYEIFIYMYTDVIEYKEYQKIKETVNFKILEILDDEGVHIAVRNNIKFLE